MIEIEGIVGYVSAYYKLLSFVDAKEALSFAPRPIDRFLI